MAFQVAETHVDEQDKPFWKQYKLFHATLAQFTYTGAQGESPSPFSPILFTIVLFDCVLCGCTNETNLI